MQFLKRNILTLCCLTLLVAMGLCGDAWADGASLMSMAQTKTRNVFWLLPVQSLNMQPVLPMPAWQRLSVIFNQRLAA